MKAVQGQLGVKIASASAALEGLLEDLHLDVLVLTLHAIKWADDVRKLKTAIGSISHQLACFGLHNPNQTLSYHDTLVTVRPQTLVVYSVCLALLATVSLCNV